MEGLSSKSHHKGLLQVTKPYTNDREGRYVNCTTLNDPKTRCGDCVGRLYGHQVKLETIISVVGIIGRDV